jgi:hypothetical protein
MARRPLFKRQESTSFCKQKEAKKLYQFDVAPAGATQTRSGPKVFCFFLSKKKRFLSSMEA